MPGTRRSRAVDGRSPRYLCSRSQAIRHRVLKINVIRIQVYGHSGNQFIFLRKFEEECLRRRMGRSHSLYSAPSGALYSVTHTASPQPLLNVVARQSRDAIGTTTDTNDSKFTDAEMGG